MTGPTSDSSELPMFPLGTVLFPSVFLPLHVFEPRYRTLVRTCLDGGREFGVVLIERGSEVGGNDVRTDIGTVARIVEAKELEDGRWVLGTVGTRRVRVHEWLPDDPHPRALVTDWHDEVAGVSERDLAELYGSTVTLVRRVLALAAELGDAAVDATIELADDPVLGSHQVCAVAPIGPADQQALLAAPGPVARLESLRDLLAEEELVLRARLAMG